VAGFSKQIAVLALAAAGCSDYFPPVPGPIDRFYFPVGLAVRHLPGGGTALLVVSTNFDLRYNADLGGAVLAVDPDASGDALAGDPSLAVLGALNIASFGGEVDYLGGAGAGWEDELPEHACPPLAGQLSAGAAKVLVASRSKQAVYLIDMDAQGRLACDGCARAVATQALDPYDVTATCSDAGSGNVARAYVTHLRAPGNYGLLTELDLLLGTSSTLVLGADATSSGAFDRASGRIFVSSQFGSSIDLVPMRWFNALTLPPGGQPVLQAHNVATDVRGALTRQFAIHRYTDPTTNTTTTTGYLRLELFDYDLAAKSGAFVATGGGLAVYDLTPNALGEPAMRLLKMVPTCNGNGQLRVLPGRPGSRALLAMTCGLEGTLLFYDDELGAMVGRIGRDPTTGKPRLGSLPFGLAVEEREAGRCLRGPGPCTRLYVAAFDSSWVSLVELDVATPSDATIVKRIGRERD
jgi:hypothetical protein